MNDDDALRDALVAAMRRLDALGLNRGSTGNASVRDAAGAGFWITPTGMGADELQATELVWMDDAGRSRGAWEPSSEWPFHRALYRARADLQAVVHVHSPQACALASLRRGLPAFHYMVAVAGGADVPCVPYHPFGSDALSDAVADGFRERNACLLANHGLVAGGTSIEHALKVALEIEALCGMYLTALSAGAPVLLSDAQMAEVIERFARYGKTRRST
jgi:L-fuculose-phosphate aldolase